MFLKRLVKRKKEAPKPDFYDDDSTEDETFTGPKEIKMVSYLCYW